MSTLYATSVNIEKVLQNLNIKSTNYGVSTGNQWFGNGPHIESHSPVDGKLISKVTTSSIEDYNKVIKTALEAFIFWRNIPAPKRGDIIRQFGNKLREKKNDLGKLVSNELSLNLPLF